MEIEERNTIDAKGRFVKGMIPWNKGKKCLEISKGVRGRKLFEEHKIKLSLVHTGKKHTIQTKIKMSESKLGKNFSKEHKKKISDSMVTFYDEKGRANSSIYLLRRGSLMKIWREAVFLRDNFTCQNPKCKFCGNILGIVIHAHHIKQIAFYPELAFDVDNGITYCANYHLKSSLHYKKNEIYIQAE